MIESKITVDDFVHVDGSCLEGGGQILRNTVTLSCLAKQPVVITNIRANRGKPGLKAQHLKGLQLVNSLCNGEMEGDHLNSTNVRFNPKVLRSGHYEVDTETAGSVCLLMQVSIPCMAFAGAPSEVLLKGGTNAEMAPPIDYYIEVFQPIAAMFGLHFSCQLLQRGFYPKGGGLVKVEVKPCLRLQPITMLDFGVVKEIHGTAYLAGKLPNKVSSDMLEASKRYIVERMNLDVQTKSSRGFKDVGTGCGIILVARTSTGCVLAGTAVGKKGKPAHEVGKEAAEMLCAEIERGACVDSYLQDQLVLLMALACGESKIRTGPITLHTKTAIFIAEKLTKAKFTIDTQDDGTFVVTCVGSGYTK